MTGFVSDIGKKLTEKWLSLLALPGLLLVAAVVIGSSLGHRHALDWRRLTNTMSKDSNALQQRPVALILLLLAFLLASIFAGFVAQGLGTMVESLWLRFGPARLGAPLVRYRQRRWDRVQDKYLAPSDLQVGHAEFSAQRARLAQDRTAISLSRPDRPTWIGDRFRSVGVRVYGQYGIDLNAAWPRLWLLIPDNVRSELRTARTGFSSATTTVAWGILFLVVGVLWWPACIIGSVLIAIGWYRSRTAADAMASLAEATVDLFIVHLAESLGVETRGQQVTPIMGNKINEQLRKGA
ncbi:hypothetical protein [Actinomadura luteofluorescens]|uniref:hypothetical protein n=1 Tax=Actinomadura luteofluorescens TaxID=46163 RepID=UPI0030CC620B